MSKIDAVWHAIKAEIEAEMLAPVRKRRRR
jgi:hypothetical protein